MRLIIATIILLPVFCFSQRQGNIWYFGDHAGLDFNSGTPIAITNGATYNAGANGSEGTAVMSDSTGSLLFYTNGQQIWNKNHQIMPHGDSILGNISSTQAALIVALPGSSQYFYNFTVDDFNNDNLKYGFRYSIIDICADYGLGDVLPNQKNIKLLDTVAEKLTAVRHFNGVDYWIIVHKYYSDAFYAYRLSSSGIIDTVISHIGSRHPNVSGGQGVGAAIGELKASPNGNKLAIVNGNAGNYGIAEYFDFDKSTGAVSNFVDIQTNGNYQYYGVSFSPDNSKLYIACWLNANGIYQFDLNASGGNADSVKASKKQVSALTSYGMQLAVDGKIYLERAGNSGSYLSVINYPNNLGTSCNYKDSAIYLNGKACSMGLPNFIDSYDYSNSTFNCLTSIATNNYSRQVTVFPNPFNDILKINSSDQSSTIELKLFDIRGLVVYSAPVKHNDIISVDKLNSGLYFYQVTDRSTKSIIVTGKLVKE